MKQILRACHDLTCACSEWPECACFPLKCSGWVGEPRAFCIFLCPPSLPSLLQSSILADRGFSERCHRHGVHVHSDKSHALRICPGATQLRGRHLLFRGLRVAFCISVWFWQMRFNSCRCPNIRLNCNLGRLLAARCFQICLPQQGYVVCMMRSGIAPRPFQEIPGASVLAQCVAWKCVASLVVWPEICFTTRY